jgi:hypothetical protein
MPRLLGFTSSCKTGALPLSRCSAYPPRAADACTSDTQPSAAQPKEHCSNRTFHRHDAHRLRRHLVEPSAPSIRTTEKARQEAVVDLDGAHSVRPSSRREAGRYPQSLNRRLWRHHRNFVPAKAEEMPSYAIGQGLVAASEMDLDWRQLSFVIPGWLEFEGQKKIILRIPAFPRSKRSHNGCST